MPDVSLLLTCLHSQHPNTHSKSGSSFYHRFTLLLLLLEQILFLMISTLMSLPQNVKGAPPQLSAVSKVAESDGSLSLPDHAQQCTVTASGSAFYSAPIIGCVDVVVSVHACIGRQACASPHALLIASAKCCTLAHCCSEACSTHVALTLYQNWVDVVAPCYLGKGCQA